MQPVLLPSAIRFCQLVIAKRTQGLGSSAHAGQSLRNNSADISFAEKLGLVFRIFIAGILGGLEAELGGAVNLVMATTDAYIECWFV